MTPTSGPSRNYVISNTSVSPLQAPPRPYARLTPFPDVDLSPKTTRRGPGCLLRCLGYSAAYCYTCMNLYLLLVPLDNQLAQVDRGSDADAVGRLLLEEAGVSAL